MIAPAIEREIGNELTETAEDGAIRVFGKNLEQLLMQLPIAGAKWYLALESGNSLRLAVNWRSWMRREKVLDTIVVFPTEPQNKVAETKMYL
ncbi:MAG: hypothetical protein V8R84_11435 [Eubacterium sp.]